MPICTASLRSQINLLVEQYQLPGDFVSTVIDYYLPLGSQIAAGIQSSACSIIAIQGSQGSGKSTCAAFLKLILGHHFGLRVLVTSLDDFYLTRAERIELANLVHPLLATRGVPGTHDLDLLQHTIHQLKTLSIGRQDVDPLPIKVPLFDKSVDDRAPEDTWQSVDQPLDLILLEGWCIGVPAQTEEQLLEPVNVLESEEDQQGIWRRYVNSQLAGVYAKLNLQFDAQITLQAPSFDCVFKWRWLQEQKLHSRLLSQARDTELTLNQEQLECFINHYQRLTEHALITMPDRTDYLIELDESHSVRRVIYLTA